MLREEDLMHECFASILEEESRAASTTTINTQTPASSSETTPVPETSETLTSDQLAPHPGEAPPLRIAVWDVRAMKTALNQIQHHYFQYIVDLQPERILRKMLETDDISILYIRHCRTESRPQEWPDVKGYYRYACAAPRQLGMPPISIILYVRRPLYIIHLSASVPLLPGSLTAYSNPRGLYWGFGKLRYRSITITPDTVDAPSSISPLPLWAPRQGPHLYSYPHEEIFYLTRAQRRQQAEASAQVNDSLPTPSVVPAPSRTPSSHPPSNKTTRPKTKTHKSVSPTPTETPTNSAPIPEEQSDQPEPDVDYSQVEELVKHLETQGLDAFTEKLTRFQQIVWEMTIARIETAQLRQKEQFDKTHIPVVYREGDMVWVKSPVKRIPTNLDQLAKFLFKWTGPQRIIRRMSDNVYRVIEVLAGFNIIVCDVQVDRLKPYHLRLPVDVTEVAEVDPHDVDALQAEIERLRSARVLFRRPQNQDPTGPTTEIARRFGKVTSGQDPDKDLPPKFHFDKIVNHAPDTRRKIDYYLVRWSGYTPDDDTWEPARFVPRPFIQKYKRGEYDNSKEDQGKQPPLPWEIGSSPAEQLPSTSFSTPSRTTPTTKKKTTRTRKESN
ncbi:hypothetical protein HK102_004846 [Quaeritorhiza haematococci]|nr:hypothetical protein HK102_004846 [Quaeritorhiza haematococci]